MERDGQTRDTGSDHCDFGAVCDHQMFPIQLYRSRHLSFGDMRRNIAAFGTSRQEVGMSARAGAFVVLGVALVSFRVAQVVVGHDLVGEAHSHATREAAVIGDRAGKGVIDGRIRTSFLLRTRHDRPRHPEYERSGQRWIGPPQPEVAPFAPTVPPTADAAPEPTGVVARRSPGPAFSVFRNTIAATSSASAVEPSVANDRNGVVTTGNWYATVSGDSALTYTPLATNTNPVYGGFCCDQVAYAVDRGGHSLVLWLQQYWFSSSAKEN